MPYGLAALFSVPRGMLYSSRIHWGVTKLTQSSASVGIFVPLGMTSLWKLRRYFLNWSPLILAKEVPGVTKSMCCAMSRGSLYSLVPMKTSSSEWSGDFFLAVELTVVGRVRVRAGGVSEARLSIHESNNLHLHEKVHAILQVTLLENDSNPDGSVASDSIALQIIAVDGVELLVNDSIGGSSSRARSQRSKKNNIYLHLDVYILG